MKFEKAKESASDTVDVAIAYCEDIRVKGRTAELAQRPDDSAFTPSDYRTVTFQIWDKVMEIEKRKALISIFQIRLNHAQHQ